MHGRVAHHTTARVPAEQHARAGRRLLRFHRTFELAQPQQCLVGAGRIPFQGIQLPFQSGYIGSGDIIGGPRAIGDTVQLFIDLAAIAAGRYPGGPAKVAVVSSAMFGTISGSSIANTVTTGSLTIPAMKRIGYKPHFAGAVEAAASAGGQITPPIMGAAAFVMIEFLNIPLTTLLIAAAIPAFMHFWGVFVQVHFEAKRLGLRGMPESEIPKLWPTIKHGWPTVIPLVLLVGVIIEGFTPYLAAFTGITVANGRFSWISDWSRWHLPKQSGAAEAETTGAGSVGFLADVMWRTAVALGPVGTATISWNGECPTVVRMIGDDWGVECEVHHEMMFRYRSFIDSAFGLIDYKPDLETEFAVDTVGVIGPRMHFEKDGRTVTASVFDAGPSCDDYVRIVTRVATADVDIPAVRAEIDRVNESLVGAKLLVIGKEIFVAVEFSLRADHEMFGREIALLEASAAKCDGLEEFLPLFSQS